MSDKKSQDQDLAAAVVFNEGRVGYLNAVSWSACRSIASAQEFASAAEDALRDAGERIDATRLLAVLKMQREALDELNRGLFFARLYFAAAKP